MYSRRQKHFRNVHMTTQYCSSHAVITSLYNIQAGHTESYTIHMYVYVCVCVCVYYTPTHDI